MINLLENNINKIETFNLTKHSLPFVISIPHSGIYFPKDMQKKVLDNVLFTNMDWYLPKLYEFLNEMDFTVIINNVSRYVIDPNRNIEQQNIEGNYNNNLVYTKTTFGKDIYTIIPDSKEIKNRIDEFYTPYHSILNQAINEKLKYFDKVYLIDLHSFGKNISTDIVLGNDNGNTTSDLFIHTVNKLLTEQGFKVQNNIPYSGGYITKYYGNEIKDCEAIQLELSYQSYIDSRNFNEEEFPNIDTELLKKTQMRMEKFFMNLKSNEVILN